MFKVTLSFAFATVYLSQGVKDVWLKLKIASEDYPIIYI